MDKDDQNQDQDLDSQDPTSGDDTDANLQDDLDQDDKDAADDSGAEPSDDKDKGGVQKRIDQLTREKYEAQRNADFYKGLAMARQTAQSNQPKPGEFDKPRPKEDDFTDYTQFIEALTDWKADKRDFEREKSRKLDKEASKNADIRAQYRKSRENHEDFDEVALNPGLPFNAAMDEASAGPNYAEILYYLGKNPGKAADIASMTPIQVAKEIGRIEAKITSKPKDKRLPGGVTPPRKLPDGGGSEPKDIEKMSRKERFAQWDKEREERIRSGRYY